MILIWTRVMDEKCSLEVVKYLLRSTSGRKLKDVGNGFQYDVCDVTLSVYPHRASLKNMPGHGGNRTYDLWNTSPMLCQLSYAAVPKYHLLEPN